MRIDRRALLAGLSGAAALSGVAQAQQTPPAQAPAPPSLTDRITARALEHRQKLEFDGARYSGAAYDMLVEEGRAAHFFLLGEEHGIAENPKLAAQLFAAFQPAGYNHVAVEISPPMASALDATARGGVDGIQRLFSDPGANVAFFGMREEAEWIASARHAAPAHGTMLWGLDYEVGADRYLIARLKAKRKPAAAEQALAALEAASNASWAQYAQTHGPQYIFSFAGDPTLVSAVRAAWPNPDPEADWMLRTLEETLEINKLWVANRGWESNARRARNMRANFHRYWDTEKPKLMFKFGASHMVRGLSNTQTFEMGSAAAELAEAMSSKSFHLMVLPGPGGKHAQFDPSAWRYQPVSETGQYADIGATPLMAAAYPDAFTLIDLRPIRPLIFGERHKALDPDLVRMIHGYDALLIMSNCTASANL